MKYSTLNTCVVLAVSTLLLSCQEQKISYAGLRASSYGIQPFPDNKTWMNYAKAMESFYPGSTGAFVWIVGNVEGNSTKQTCTVNFPLSKPVDGVNQFPLDQNETFLDMCDKKGYAVWLQVESGDSDLASLAEETMKRYKHHSSVKGFGIDVEWYKPNGTNGFGMPITDSLAEEIDKRIKSVDKRLNFFLKHWDSRWMPPTYRSDIIFVNDSQMHKSLESMKGEFSAWAEFFYPNPVMFQIGYETDEDLWNTYANPIKELGDFLAHDIPKKQKTGIVWVDFSLREVMTTQGIGLE